MMIHDITTLAGKYKARKRVGRGTASGTGRRSGRGQKGASSRSGYSAKLAFEGGQMPYFRRLRKFGFSNVQFTTRYWIVNLRAILGHPAFAKGGEVNMHTLQRVGLVRDDSRDLKILGDLAPNEKVTVKLKVTANRFSAKARQQIVAAGGTVKETGTRRDRIRGIDRMSDDWTPRNLTKKLKRSSGRRTVLIEDIDDSLSEGDAKAKRTSSKSEPENPTGPRELRRSSSDPKQIHAGLTNRHKPTDRSLAVETPSREPLKSLDKSRAKPQDVGGAGGASPISGVPTTRTSEEWMPLAPPWMGRWIGPEAECEGLLLSELSLPEEPALRWPPPTVGKNAKIVLAPASHRGPIPKDELLVIESRLLEGESEPTLIARWCHDLANLDVWKACHKFIVDMALLHEIHEPIAQWTVNDRMGTAEHRLPIAQLRPEVLPAADIGIFDFEEFSIELLDGAAYTATACFADLASHSGAAMQLEFHLPLAKAEFSSVPLASAIQDTIVTASDLECWRSLPSVLVLFAEKIRARE